MTRTLTEAPREDGKGSEIQSLTAELCGFRSGVVARENEALFARMQREFPMELLRYSSGAHHLGWEVPRLWEVKRAEIWCDGKLIYDGAKHPLGVGMYSRSFEGELSLEALAPHLVSVPALPDALSYHCIWLYRPWDADWAFSIPHRVRETMKPGRYQVRLETTYEDGEMLVGVGEHRGASDRTVVFQAHNCHPAQANDGFAGVAILLKLFQWLSTMQTRYTYRLVVVPEHLGSVFYLKDRPRAELERIVGGVFAELPSTGGPIVASSTLRGGHPLDDALRNACRAFHRGMRTTAFRGGIGNDETVWEAPGYEVPFAQLSCSLGQPHHYPEYHTSLDTPDRLDPADLAGFLDVLKSFVMTLERDAVFDRTFDGFPSLSSPRYRLYRERFDPAVDKRLDDDAEAWGRMADVLYRLFDGQTSALAIAERFELPFAAVRDYLAQFEEKGLVVARPVVIPRAPISTRRASEETPS